MTTLDDLLALRDLDPQGAADFLGVDLTSRRPITGYGQMHSLDALSTPDSGVRFLLHDDQIVLVYVREGGVPDGLDHQAMLDAVTGEPATLRSRQGKHAQQHVLADQGVAWSELDGQIGFIEIFPPTNLEDYTEWVYEEPPVFRQ